VTGQSHTLAPARPSAALAQAARRWPALLGAALTCAMVAGLGRALLGDGLAGLSRAVPASAPFFLCFALLYLSPPFFDYVIFRRLWGIPTEGFVALLKKRVANEVVFGYAGDAYFYAWARARATGVAAPFGAVKDVTILSAIAGNLVTLIAVGLALPFGQALLTVGQGRAALVAGGVMIATSVPFLLFSRRVFSLSAPVLRWIFGVHCLRLMAGQLLIALAWHFGLPEVGVGLWLVLAAGRLLVSRLPIPNKDLAFVNLAILVIGPGHAVSELLAVFAALTLAVHVALIAAFGLWALVKRLR